MWYNAFEVIRLLTAENYEALNLFRDEAIPESAIPMLLSPKRINALLELGLVVYVRSFSSSPSCLFIDTSHYRITGAGEQALCEFEEDVKRRAKDEAEKKHRRSAEDLLSVKKKKEQSRHDFVVAAFSVTLTLFFEHFGEIVDFVKKLFGE